MVLFKKLIFTDFPTVGGTAGCTPAQASKLTAERAQKESSAPSLKGGKRETKVWRTLSRIFFKNWNRHCDFKIFLVLEVNRVKQVSSFQLLSKLCAPLRLLLKRSWFGKVYVCTRVVKRTK